MPPPCHRRAVVTGSNGATQDSAWATQLIWNNWKHLSPSLICCMTEYSRCDDLTWERGRAPGRMMAPHHGNEGSFRGPCPRWAIAGLLGAAGHPVVRLLVCKSNMCTAPGAGHRDQGSAAQPAPKTRRA